jgi:hypothetical protein
MDTTPNYLRAHIHDFEEEEIASEEYSWFELGCVFHPYLHGYNEGVRGNYKLSTGREAKLKEIGWLHEGSNKIACPDCWERHGHLYP